MASAVLLDTDVMSFLLKGDSRADLYREHVEGRIPVLSFMTVAELYQWAETRSWGETRREGLDRQINACVVHGCTRELCRVWARIRALGSAAGRPVQAADAWLAATALVHDIPLATHNGRHYEGVEGLQIICEA